MIAWLTNNLSTIILCAVLIAIVTAVIVYMIRNKKKGKSSCGCGGCQHCPMGGHCHSDSKK